MILAGYLEAGYHDIMLNMLPTLPLFQGLTAKQTTMLMTVFEKYICPANTIILEQGRSAHYLYLILKGNASIVYKPYDGPQIVLTRLKDGDVFGWSAVVGTNKYTSSVVSTSELDALRVHNKHLQKLKKTDPETSKIIIDRLALNVSPRWKDAHKQIVPMITSERIKMESPKATDRESQVRHLLDNLSAYIEQFHGGTVEFVSLTDNDLKVRLGGACLNCPLQPSTLHGWVEGTVHQFFPSIHVTAAD